MEISKGLQEEILTVQNKLKNAIRDHQICMGKLKDDPNNTDIPGQIQKIHLHIVSLGRCQKQVFQRLRKEVAAFETENANGAKVSIASLLGLNNNNHITNNNETKLKAGSNNFSTKSSKEDYEDIVRNGDVPSPARNAAPTKQRSSSVETISGGEDDVIEVSMDENSNEKPEKEEPEKECKVETTEKLNFLCALGLITTLTFAELQNKRAERKRRSTANPQFIYSSLEVPTKRKRYSYLQSGNVPQTRQTTARMNGPSPPPVKVAPTKSVSPPSRSVMKSLIPVQKSTTRPNILRNVAESKVFVNKTKVENGPNQMPLPVPTVKSVQSVGSKAVHIPGLPSSLTIERIGSDSAVCISCRNPGTLTVCENCASNYHVSCHSISPAPPRICPKCALMEEEEVEDCDEEGDEEEEEGRPPFKKDEEIATTSHTPGIIRKTREDSEIYKTTCGLHKTDAAQKKRGFSSSIGISQLPSSTFLIPISSNNVPSSTVNQPEVGPSTTISAEPRESNTPYSSIVLNQLSRPSITYFQTEPQVSYAYQLPVSSVQPEKHQSYLIVKKITDPSRRSSQSSEDQGHASMLNYQLPTTSGYNNNPRVQTEISVANSSMFLGKHLPDNLGRNRKKQTNRAVPALNRIIGTENLSITAEYQLERSTFNGRKSRARQSRTKYGFNQLRSAKATEILLPSYDAAESDKQLQIAKSAEPEEATILGGRQKYRPRTGGLLHSLFAGHNKCYIVTDHNRESRELGGTGAKDHTVLRQQLYNQNYQLDAAESNESAVQLQRGALTKFFEHVKLEEAHIPAPSRSKLVYKGDTPTERNDLDVTDATDENVDNEEYPGKPPLLSNNYEDDFTEREIKQSSWLSNRLIAKKCHKKDNVAKTHDSLDSIPNLIRTNNFITYERKPSNSYIRVECEPDDDDDDDVDDDEDDDDDDDDDDDEATLAGPFQSDVPFSKRMVPRRESVPENRRDRRTSVSLRNAQSNLLELRNEVSVPEDKADTERQDLSSGRRSTSSSRNSSSSDSDTPEQAMNDTIKHSRRRMSGNEYEERLGINAVSPESMQVLEQFESAMLETDCSNAATC